LDPDTFEVTDFSNGLEDIESKTLSTIGNPKERFLEDNLRILRAVRFSNKYDLKIEKETESEIINMADKIQNVSAERIREEFVKIITGKNSGRGLRVLSDYGLMKYIIPEIEELKGVAQPPEFHPEGDVFVHTCLVLDKLEEDGEFLSTLALGALLHDIGKPQTYTKTDRVRFNRHEYVGASMAEKICKRLKFSNKQIADIKLLVAEHMKFGNIKDMKKSTFKKFVSIDNFDLHLRLHKADCLASHGDLSLLDFTNNKIEELSNEPIKPDPLVNGDDLISLGLEPGPKFKEILLEIFDEQLEGSVTMKEEGLKLAKKLIQKL
jgi:poly(A) polymerase